MNRKAVRVGAATVMAALAFGVAGTTAHAATAGPVRAEATSTTLDQRVAAQQLAANLLRYEGDRFNAQERAELQSIADGNFLNAKGGKLDPLVKLLKKVGGFAKAVGGKYNDFKNWYNGLPWYVKAPLAAAGVGSNLFDIWSLFH